MKHKKFLAVFLVIFVFVSHSSCNADKKNNEPFSWEINDGTLNIKGGGDMPNYASYSDIPWYEHRNQIKNIVINDGIKSIGDNAFCHLALAESVTIPKSVVKIGNFSFLECDGLQSISIPKKVKSIGESAFLGCDGIKSISLPEAVENVGENAFSLCSSLEKISVPKKVTSISKHMFFFCESLTEVSLPKNIKNIDKFAFALCDALQTIRFDGTTAMWNSIPKGELWNDGIDEFTIVCTDGNIQFTKNN